MSDMRTDDSIDGILLSAFVDGQLDGPTRATVIQAMEEDPGVRARVHGSVVPRPPAELARQSDSAVKLEEGVHAPSLTPVRTTIQSRKLRGPPRAEAVGPKGPVAAWFECRRHRRRPPARRGALNPVA